MFENLKLYIILNNKPQQTMKMTNIRIMKTIKNLILVITLSSSCCLFSQGWVQQTGQATAQLKGVFFINENTGWSVGDAHTIQRTSNGGASWTLIDISTSDYFENIFFTDPNTGWIVTSSLYKSTNSGFNWVNMGTLGGSFGSVYFINSMTGWCVGSSSGNARIIKTTNGGVNWSVKPCQTTNILYKSAFPSQSVGYACGINGTIVKSTDGGENWMNMPNDIDISLRNIYFLNTETGWVFGQPGGNSSRIYQTTNGGLNWHITYNFSDLRIYSLHFADINKGWICGWGSFNSRIFYTSNGGANWNQQLNIQGDGLFAMQFINSQTGWAVGGDNGRIFRTTNGGLTGLTQGGTEVPERFSLQQNYPNPFNPSTTIRFDIPERSFIQLSVFSLSGELVEKLLDRELYPGKYEYTWNASSLASGIYFYRITSGGFNDVKKMILIK